MRHLNADSFFQLAEKTNAFEPYCAKELLMIDHLRECKECYGKFCCALVLSDVLSETGSFILTNNPIAEANFSQQPEKSNVLAVIRMAVKQISGVVTLLMEHLDQATSIFAFEPSLSSVSRGTGMQQRVTQLVDLAHENTFVLYDAASHELTIQIDTSELPEMNLKVYIVKGETRTEVPLDYQGDFLIGTVHNVAEDEFQLIIEENT